MLRDSKTLARLSASQAERFLAELANLGDDSLQRFIKRYGDLFKPRHYVHEIEELKQQWESTGLDWTGTQVLGLRNLVRRAWIAPDIRTREYLLFLAQREDLIAGDARYINNEFTGQLSPPSQIEQALIYLRRCGNLARYCANADCPAPYFIAKRKSQKYCTDACSAPAQREFKRRWWADHGEEWRAARVTKKTVKKGRVK